MRHAALTSSGGILSGIAPASNGGQSTPGRKRPGADAPLAHLRPGYPLVGRVPAVPTSVSPGRCDVPQGPPASKSKPPAAATGGRVTATTAGPSVAKD